ncbi:MAG: PilN domain-containing protein [bacterium]
MNRGRCAPVEVLDTVTCCLPVKQSLSLTSLSHSERRVSFRGSSLEFGSIVDFVQCLEGSAIFNSAKLGRWNGNRGVFDFEILCLLEP